MTQVIKMQGIIRNPVGRPIITSAPFPPFAILDARRYANQFSVGSTHDSVSLIGSMRKEYLLMSKTMASGSTGFTYKEDGGRFYFSFDEKQSLASPSVFPPRGKNMTIVVVYKVDEPSWFLPMSTMRRVVSLGTTAQNSFRFGVLRKQLVSWSTYDLSTEHLWDEPYSGWSVAVINSNGSESRVVDRFGSMRKIAQSTLGTGSTSIALFGSRSAPDNIHGGLMYFAAYDSIMSDLDLMNLFNDAKNDFNIP